MDDHTFGIRAAALNRLRGKMERRRLRHLAKADDIRDNPEPHKAALIAAEAKRLRKNQHRRLQAQKATTAHG